MLTGGGLQSDPVSTGSEFLEPSNYYLSNGYILRWLSCIPDILRPEGVEIVHNERYLIRPDLFKPFADDFCLALYDIGRLAASKNSELFGAAEIWRSLFEDMLTETSKGVGITMDMLVCVGRK